MPDKKLIAITLHYDDGTSEEVVIPPPSDNPEANNSLVFWGNAKDGAKSVGLFSDNAAIQFVGHFLRKKPELLRPVIEHATGAEAFKNTRPVGGVQ